MWIILLDHSGSMGNPFGGKSEFAGRSRKSRAAVKLDAAKETLIDHLSGLGTPNRIALFEFTSTASLIFDGMSNDRVGVQTALDSLHAENGTDISAALIEAGYFVQKTRNVPIFRLLVISDGLSDRTQAEQAANDLIKKGVVIDVILIDPTDDGEQVARAIAINGTVWAVTSSKKLSQDINEAAIRQQELAKQAEEIQAAIDRDKREVATKVRPAERLSFTAGYPGAVSPGSWYSLLVYLHLARLQNEAMEILRQKAKQIGLKPATSTIQAASLVERGTWLRLTPRVEGVIFNPLSQEVAWYEDIQEVNFRLQADDDTAGRSLLGAVEIYSGPVLIAQIPLAINVRQLGMPDADTESVTSTVKIFDSVFASYSTKDTPIIDACVSAYKALGIYVYIDKHSLRGGRHWQRMLYELIEQSDLFQLYWSHAASQSSYVEDEWHHALLITGRKGETFIRPLCWEEDWPEPPSDLAHIQFTRLDLRALAQLTGHSLQVTKAQLTKTNTSPSTTPSLPVAVLPILPGTMPEMKTPVQEDVSFAVNFLEQTTGLRYYPVPTLLVDEYVIKSVRAIDTVELSPENIDQRERALGLAEVLQSIALAFHVGKLHPESIDIDQLPKAFGEGRKLTPAQFDYVRRACEWVISQVVEHYFEPDATASTWQRINRELADLDLPFGPDLDFVGFMQRFLTLVQDLLKEGLEILGDFEYVENSFSVSINSWELLRGEVADLSLEAIPSKWSYSNEQKVLLRGPYSEFVRTFDVASESLIEVLYHYNYLMTPLHRLFAVEAPTYGIYVSDDTLDADETLKHWAFARNIPTELTLPQASRVLFCLNTYEQFEKKLQEGSVSYRESRQLARDFQRCVLIHEHFHAILELGLDEKRQSATGLAFPEAWRAALGLNESLAVWMELHAARKNPKLTELIWAYIRAGSYPEWPYRGAEWIENVYQQHGVKGVRELITSLRNDPKSAQIAFDATPFIFQGQIGEPHEPNQT